MSRLWNIADLIDLHFFCRLDDEAQGKEGEAALAKRDRTIYLAKIEPHLGKMEEAEPRQLVRRWLAVRRLQFRQEKGQQEQVLPGSLWQELSVISRGLAVLFGVLIGAGSAGSLLLYSGNTPLNVSVYFGLFVLLQLLLFLGGGGLFFYRYLRRLSLDTSTLYMILGRMLVRTMDTVRRKLQRHISGKQRLDLAALVGGIQQRRESAILMLWPAFILVQLGGIGFNVGVLGATLSKVIFSDMAFAWQSSLQLSSELVTQIVQWVAMPWSWILPQAVPTLTQIQGSQMVLKEGISHLATADLLSWWPFLCCSVAVYGLLPRILLLVMAWNAQHRLLEQLRFSSLRCSSLLRRMTAPRIDTNGVGEAIARKKNEPLVKQTTATEVPPSLPVDFVREPISQAEKLQVLVLIADELYDDCPLEQLTALLAQQNPGLHFEPQRYDESISEGLLSPSTDFQGDPPTELFVLLEAWQPPLRETESFLGVLRTRFGQDIPITIVLIGKPTPQTMLTPPDPEQFRIWRQKMQALGDANLAVQPVRMP